MTLDTDSVARAAAEVAARQSYGKLLSWLAWQWRDIAAAEDALSDALALALEHWPRQGVPHAPEAWLMTTAKRQLLQHARRRRLEEDPASTVLLAGMDAFAHEVPAVPDDRLRLMFVCAHPAIDPAVRCALMLQTQLGLDAAAIARVSVVSPEAMAKRLVRAKAKIKATGLRFEWPDADELPDRVDAVLDAIYGAFTLGADAPEDHGLHGLTEEALYLARLMAARLPDHSECLGLQALLMLCHARRRAQRDEHRRFVPLDQQDPARWDHPMRQAGLAVLAQAARLEQHGPFQIEAAIQAAHTERLLGGEASWQHIVRLYDRLLRLHPSVGARTARAVALWQAQQDCEAALAALDELAADVPATLQHQPWWAARAHVLTGAGRVRDAADALAKARALSASPALRDHFDQQMLALGARLH
ncbi:RNA polymerase sigma factor [Hydrogenophaga sp.]|uniref:RNA polymerase sigma factor n=1 Tax=Hydrogenophaga sp. TaxID=1904254 RepID=UPI003AF9D43B